MDAAKATQRELRDEDAAAAKLQAAQRGRVTRKEVELMQSVDGGTLRTPSKLKRSQTGAIDRRALDASFEDERHAAATKLQSMQRGRSSRNVSNPREEEQEQKPRMLKRANTVAISSSSEPVHDRGLRLGLSLEEQDDAGQGTLGGDEKGGGVEAAGRGDARGPR